MSKIGALEAGGTKMVLSLLDENGVMLERESIPVFALDLDPERVREAAAAGDALVFGDAAKKEVLLAAGLMRAKALVITYSDTHSSIRILQVVQQPKLPLKALRLNYAALLSSKIPI